MKINEITPILNKLEEMGYGEVDLYTHDEDHKGLSFHLYLQGIHENEFKKIFPTNPFVRNCEINAFSISPEMSIHDTDIEGLDIVRDKVLTEVDLKDCSGCEDYNDGKCKAYNPYSFSSCLESEYCKNNFCAYKLRKIGKHALKEKHKNEKH